MELLYVWIEDYNNIHHQGFNFSPKHRFHFEPAKDEDGKVTGGTLTHEEINPNYPKSFFGEHISNITAIVGKNGSGKSSLIKVILNNKKTGSIILYKDRGVFYLISDIVIRSNFNYSTGNNIELLRQSIFYSPFINSNTNYVWAGLTGDISSMTKLANSLLPFNSKNKAIASFHIEEMLLQITFVSWLKEEKLIPFDVPTDIKLILPYDIESPTLSGPFLKNIYSNIVQRIKKDQNQDEQEYDINEIEGFVKKLDNKEYEIKDIPERSLVVELSVEEVANLDFLTSRGSYLSGANRPTVKSWIKEADIRLTWRDCSDGEASFLSLMARLWDVLYNIGNGCLIVLDEFEVGIHSEWQIKIVARLMTFLKLLGTRGHHLILTTHSPFLVSDLPRENIIFLKTEKDEKGKPWCKVCEPKKMERTFGANIHSLYRNSFFMQNGLMGEFAENKIQEVLDYLNGIDQVDEDKKKKVRFIIDQIGEPLIREMLLKKYDMKFHFNVEDRILTLEKELKALKARRDDTN